MSKKEKDALIFWLKTKIQQGGVDVGNIKLPLEQLIIDLDYLYPD